MKAQGPVLAAVDLSEISGAVARCAGRASARLGAGLTVFHAVDGLTGGEEAGLLLPTLRRQMERARQEALSCLEEVMDGAGLEGRAGAVLRVGPGPADEAIVEQASATGARLVVLGAPHPHLFPGSTAERVARHCPCPVLVVRRPPEGGYRHVLVGVDGSPGAERAWADARALAEPGAQITACHVVEGPGDGARECHAAAELERWVRARLGGETVRLLVDCGNPRTALVSAAQREGVDLLAVGRRGGLGVAEALLGSVAERAVAGAPCDVLAAGGEEE